VHCAVQVGPVALERATREREHERHRGSPARRRVTATVRIGRFDGTSRSGMALARAAETMSNLLLVIIVLVLLFGWGGGMAYNVGGGLIHLLLVVAVIVVVVRLVTGRRAL
jgi:hypothetical protein